VRTDLEIECLASQLPEFVTIDLSGLTKGQSLHASDLKLPDGIKVVKHGTLNPVIGGQLPFLGSVRLAPLRGRRRHLRSRSR
jgi:hypothetical protein